MVAENESISDFGYTLTTECVASKSINVKKYQSSRTGITLITANVPGPLVHGFFVVATEAENDDGLPHTLEHLIFLGSADYPYKGTLDIIANRCLASGTNAWTDIDHTAYTVSTAGAEGFLALFPIYLDHLFFPTLTEAGFITEVYHVTDEGKDAGVVFCEMQHYECTAELLTQLELMKGLYTEKCGYRYETGGAVNNLRKSTSIDKIRKFHNKFYRAENLTIIVAGLIKEIDLIKALYKFEEKLLRSGENLKCQKAWQDPVPILQKSNIKAVTYPSDKEDHGVVIVGWQGPSVVNDYNNMIAVTMLCNYLVDTAASPLRRSFVEIEEPYCSDISVTVVENSISAVYLTFKNVVIEKIPYLSDELLKILRSIAEDKDDFKIDPNRMKTVIDRFVLKQLLALEKEPQNEITQALISNVLYGNSQTDMFDRLNHDALAEKFKAMSVDFWRDLLKKFLIDRPHVTVLGYPSQKDRGLRSHLETERRNNQLQTLGKEGLAKKGEILKKASEENEKLPPNDLIASIDAPDASNLHFETIARFTTSTPEQHPRFNISSAPVFTQLDDIKSNFAYLYVMMDSSKLSKDLRIYLPLFLEYILECPVYRNDQLISHETVAQELESDVIKMKSCLGLLGGDKRFSCSSLSLLVSVSMVVLPEKFERGICWLRDILFNSRFTRDRLKIVVRKLISSISQIRRQGNVIIKDLLKIMIFDSETNHEICSVLNQLNFLSELAEKLNDDLKFESIIQDLDTLRSRLTQPGNVVLHISANVSRLADLYSNPARVLSQILTKNALTERKRINISQDKEYLRKPLNSKYKSCVVGMANVDSAYLYHCCESINDFYHPDLPALLVFIQFITQLEGPLWRDVRGFGLAYHYSVRLSPEDGVLLLLFSRATDVVQAFRRTRDIFLNSINTTNEWNVLHFESGKSSLIFEIAEREKNVINLANESLLSYFTNTSADYNRELIQKVKNVKISDMEEVGKRYIAPLFDQESSLTAILCDQTNTEEIKDGFSQLGKELVLFSSLEESYMNSASTSSN
ncbi:uncharacterized protein C05D11.1-like [Planococcus citri]|uniref:uncharacterized protein C05D11.1-like n=1 Tax=Planococcus citri TaxID=170843 RepID=UPI0031F896E6